MMAKGSRPGKPSNAWSPPDPRPVPPPGNKGVGAPSRGPAQGTGSSPKIANSGPKGGNRRR